jgi:NADPH-dependent glutamate synthase beta subunit-like oxidoreductase
MNQAILDGDLERAGRIVKDTIPLPATLGRICPTPCEGRCRRKAEDGALAVCLLKRHVGDYEIDAVHPFVPQIPPPSGKRVAVIGAGPAGLSATYFLLRHGHAVDVFDERDEPGGALRSEIPAERLPREVLDAEIDVIRLMGARFHQKTRVDVAQKRLEYDAVVVAFGTTSEADTPPGIERAAKGIKVQKGTGQTSLDGVFAAGGAVAPGKISVRSIGDAHAVADHVHKFLTGQTATIWTPFNLEVDRTQTAFVQSRLKLADPHPRTAPAGDGLSSEEAKQEAARCLQCGCAKVDSCVLRSLATRYGLDPSKFKGSSRPVRIDDSHDEIVFEENKCTSCGICVRVAAEFGETLGLSFRGRGFETRVGAPFGEPLAAALKKAARACAEQCPTGALSLRPGTRRSKRSET